MNKLLYNSGLRWKQSKDPKNNMKIELGDKSIKGDKKCSKISEIIPGQNSVRLSDAALDYLFFSKICFIKSSLNML